MNEMIWQEFNKAGRIVTKRRRFASERAMERFIAKLFEKDSFYQILATR